MLGIGGLFLRSKNPKTLMEWYQRHLGLTPEKAFDGFQLSWPGDATLAVFGAGDGPFRSPDAQFMLNLAVDDVRALVARLRAAGVEVEEKIEDHEFGVFAWAKDPDGRTIELYQPKT